MQKIIAYTCIYKFGKTKSVIHEMKNYALTLLGLTNIASKGETEIFDVLTYELSLV